MFKYIMVIICVLLNCCIYTSSVEFDGRQVIALPGKSVVLTGEDGTQVTLTCSQKLVIEIGPSTAEVWQLVVSRSDGRSRTAPLFSHDILLLDEEIGEFSIVGGGQIRGPFRVFE